MATEGIETRRSSGTAKSSQQQTEDYRLDLFGRHIPRILVKQLIAKLVDQFIYQSYDNDLDQIGAFSCTPSIGRFDAALLFVDISGFTVLSQRLPVDELRLCINNYFKIILDTIIRHGGDVVKFAGDALFVIWPVDEDKPYIPVDLSTDLHHSHKHEPDEAEKLHRMQYAVARAVNCGIEINRLCSNYRVDLKKKIVNDIEVPISRLLLDQDSLASSSLPIDTPSPVQSSEEDFTYLNVHSGCACGTLAGIDVGAADRWEYVMIGDPLRDVADAESAAEKGEIVLSAFIHNVMCGNTYVHPEREEITEEELKARSATLDLSTSGDTLLPCGCSRTANGCFRLNQEKSVVIPDAPQVSEEDEDHEQADLELAYYRQVMEYAKRAFDIGKPVIMKRFIEYLKNENNKESNSNSNNNESESKKSLLSTSSSLPNLPPASSLSVATTNASPSTTPTSSSSVSPQLEQFVYDFYIKWLLNCLTADFARHVHEADRIDFTIARMNRLNCLESCAKEYKAAASQGMFSSWRPPAIELENMMKNRETSESFVRKIRNLVGHTSSTTSSISTHSTGAISSTTASISVNTTATASSNNNYLREKNQKKHERLLKKDRELNGELRNVIVMFIAIKSETKSITLDPDDDENFKLTECAFTAFNFIPRSKSERDADTKLKKHYQTCMSLIVTSLKEKGGQLRQFIVDDKGTVAIGSFGLRGSTTYDNAASAVEAALNIIVHLQNVGLNASIGITSGKAYCGVVGSVRRHEYAVMGPSVNLSARLMGKAKSGEIICDISTRSVDRVHSYRNVGEVKAKGYTNLVSIFKPVFNRGSVMMTFGDRASFQHIENVPSQTPRRQGSEDEMNGTNNNNANNLVPNSKQGSKQMGHIKRIIGRDSEEFDIINTLLNDVIDMNACSKPTEADIEQLVQEIQQGTHVSDNYISDSLLNTSCQSRMIVVHGPSGIGKSALINVVNDKLMRYSKKATWNLQIVLGKSSSLTVSDPFKPWQAVIRSILSQLSRYENIVHERREPELDLSDRTLVVKKWIKGLHYLSSYLSDEEKNWFPLLSAARIVPNIPDNDVTSKLSGQQKLELVIQLLTSIIRQYPILSNKVLLIIFDDSHFMDAHSWKLVNVVLQSIKGVIFLASYYDAKESGASLLSGDEEAQIESKSTTTAMMSLPNTTISSNDTNNIIHTAILNLSSCRRISLTGLNSSSIRDMASHIFEGYNLSNLDDSIFHKLEEISGGNPLYIYEIGLACLEKLRCYAQDTNCDLNTIFDGGENSNKVFQHMLSEFRTNRIDEVIYYRFDRLDAQSQLILKMGSVITISNSHRGFNLEMLMHMLDRSISNASSPMIAGIDNNTDALRASTSSGGNKELLCLFACLDLKDTGHKKYLKAAETLSKKLKEMVNQNSFIKIIRTRRRSSFNDSTKDEMMNEILNLQSASFDFDLFDPNASFTTSAKKTQSMEEYEERLRKEMIDICYDFNISLERKTIYDLMLDDQKESLHDRVANQLERENEEANSSNYLTFSDLNEEAFHWEKATVWGNAMSCYYRAGMLLDSLGALQECYKYLGNAYRMLILLRKDAKIKEQDYHSITFDVLLKEFEFLNNTLHPYDGDVKLSEDSIDKKLSLKTSLIAGKYSLTRIDIYNTFGGDSNLLEIAINLLLRFGQTSFTLGENPNITSRIYEDAIRLMLLTWPRKHDHKNDSRDFTDDVSNHYNLHNLHNNSNKRPQRPILINTQAKLAEIQEQVDSFKLQDPSICFPLIAGMASLYRTRRLADDEEHTKEKILYQIMLNFAKTSPVYYRVHHLQAICLMNSLYNEYGNYEDAIMCLIDIKSLYNYEQHSNSLVKTYGNDRVPFTFTVISQYLLLLGYIPQAMVLREKLSNTWLPMMTHLHSMGTLALPLSAMNLLLCHVGEADRIFNHYRQTELSRPGAYSFFRDTNCMIDDYFQVKNLFLKEKYSELIGLFQRCDMMKSSSSSLSPSSEQKNKEEIRPGDLQSCNNKEHHNNTQQGHLLPMIQKIINKSYLIKENRPLLFDAILSFGLPVEFLCSDILVMLTESLTITNIHLYNPRDLLLLAIEYCDIAIDLTKIGHRHLFAYIVMVIAKLRIYLHLVKCPKQLEVDYQESKDGLIKHIQEILIIIRENDFILVYLLILKVFEHYCTPNTNIFTANELMNCVKAPSSIIGESIESMSLQECIKRLQEYYLQQIINKNENFYSDNDENHVKFQSLFNSHFTSETLISTLHQNMNMIYEGVNKTYQQQ